MRTSVRKKIAALHGQIDHEAQQTARGIAALMPLREIEADEIIIVVWSWRTSIMLMLDPEHSDQVDRVVREVLHATGKQRASKIWDETTGQITYVIDADDKMISIRATPSRCKVRVVEERVVVPARTEVRRRFVIDNPEECAGDEVKAA